MVSMEMMDFFVLFRTMNDSSKKAAVITMELDVKLYRSVFENVPKTIKEIINPTPQSICVQSNNFFNKLNREVMNKLISGGVIQHYLKYFFDFLLKPRPESKEGPKVFGVEDLKFGFIIWLFSCCIATSVFVMEIISFNLRKCVGLICLIRTLNGKFL
jgi:hypothetical protein